MRVSWGKYDWWNFSSPATPSLYKLKFQDQLFNFCWVSLLLNVLVSLTVSFWPPWHYCGEILWGGKKLIVMFHGSQSSSCKLKLHSTLLNTKKIGFGKLPQPWRCNCHLPDKPCSSNAYLWAHTLGSNSRWTKQNLINRLGLKKHLKRQLIMFYMTGNATQKQKRSELLNKHFHYRMAPSSKKKKKKVQTASKLVLQLLPVLDSDIQQLMFKAKIRGESKEEKVQGGSMHTHRRGSTVTTVQVQP